MRHPLTALCTTGLLSQGAGELPQADSNLTTQQMQAHLNMHADRIALLATLACFDEQRALLVAPYISAASCLEVRKECAQLSSLLQR